MRYFDCTLGTNSEQIFLRASFKIQGSFPAVIYQTNGYINQNIKNKIQFFFYREETMMRALLGYDERRYSFKSIEDYLDEIVKKKLGINRPLTFREITIFEAYEYWDEAKRREIIATCRKDILKMDIPQWFLDYSGDVTFLYQFEEHIIQEKTEGRYPIYDNFFLEELSGIEKNINSTGQTGNAVHYVMSCKSFEAACDMTETLIAELIKANRISSRRLEIIKEIHPDLHKDIYFESIIENNCGGTVLIDLSGRMEYNPTAYIMAGKYIEKMVKKYRNQCLFVFAYNIDHPGFSYYLLPELKKYVVPVTLKEGKGNRKAAVDYMESLIKKSEYSEYADLADEYMKLFPGTEFFQTDVLAAHEQFEAWCIGRNMNIAYDEQFGKEFYLDREKNEDSSYDQLNQLIGLSIVKKQIESIIASDVIEKERKKRKGKNYQTGSMHMVFCGNPGSAKTTVAKLFGGIAKERNILKSGAFAECGGMDLDGIGCVHKIREAFLAAKGGVLFIDEAYSLKSDVAVTTLIQEMENHRDDVIVILAGYDQRMRQFMEINEGLKSRIPYWVEFPDYTTDELTEILIQMTYERGFEMTAAAVKKASCIFEKVRITENFGNGRYVRNLLERAIKSQAARLISKKPDVSDMQNGELFLITEEDIEMLDEGLKDERQPGTAKRELGQMIGLSSVKKVISKAIANCSYNKICSENGIAKNKASLHMVFTGNPGTAKTTVARLFAEILKDEKVLATGKFVEAGRADLVGDHVGATAPLVRKKFKEAQGGVLFIDEAYSLCDSYENGFGDEAINTLVQEMENHREDVIVVFAGYPEPMKEFLDRNPGMLSRIAFQIEFEDYSMEELCDITRLMISQNNMTITAAAMKKLKHNYSEARKNSDYGNGRYVRKILEETKMNLAERIMHLNKSDLSAEMLTTIQEEDIPENVSAGKSQKHTLGFSMS